MACSNSTGSSLLTSFVNGIEDVAASMLGSNTQKGTVKGILMDCRIEGVAYKCGGTQGVTDAAGQFVYKEGHRVTFSVGDVQIGDRIIPTDPVLTLLDLVPNAQNINDPVVHNISQFLLSLDTDGNPDNGIEITPEAALACKGITVDFTSVNFESDPGFVQAMTAAGRTVLDDATVRI